MMKLNKSSELPLSIQPLLWVMAFDHTALNITFPILTFLFFDLQSSLFEPATTHAVRSMWYGICVALPPLTNLVMTPLLSAWSDRVGRRIVLLIATIGALLFALVATLGIVTGMLSLLILSCFIQGAFSRTNPIAQAAMGDLSVAENKVFNMGYLQSAISFGAFLGPIIGGFLAVWTFFPQVNFALPFIVAALFAAISFFITLLYFKETLTIKNTSPIYYFSNIKKSLFLSSVPIRRISLILFLSQISWSLYFRFIPPVLKLHLHFSPHILGLFVGSIALWLALATSFGLRLIKNKLQMNQIMLCASYLILIGISLTIFCNYVSVSYVSLIGVWLAAIPTAMGDAILYSCLITLYSNCVSSQEQGRIMGLCFIIVSVIWSITALVGGYVMSFSSLLPLMLAPFSMIAVIILLHTKSKHWIA